MKKIISVSISLFLFSQILNAQSIKNRTNFWHFNFNAAIDFNSGSPVSINNSALYTYEGTTSISDSNGYLMFYTGGGNIYNANNALMVNGNGLTQGSSASQSCLAVPKPGSNTIWYLFTVSDGGTNNVYSIIDMSLQGGLGEVTQKNIQLFNSGEEKITGCHNANNIDYWVILRKSGGNKYNVYPVTSAGVGAAVVSNTGPLNNGGFVGCMKLSPDGSRMAVSNYSQHNVYLYKFDNASGVVTYDTTIYVADNFYAYGVEWSCDGKRLYLGSVDYTPGEVYQYDMTQPTNVLILASKQLIMSTNDILGTLQMGPDGKIYLNRYNVYHLGVINNPDEIGAACNYVNNGFSVSPHLNYLGLPNYITSWLYCNNVSIPDTQLTYFSASDTIICQKFCIDYFDESLNNPIAWNWNFEGGSPSTSTMQNPTQICYNTPGTYDVTLITSFANGKKDTLQLIDYMTVNPTPQIPSITQNGYVLTSSPASSYQWQFNSEDIPGATQQSYTATETGFYTVVVGDETGCFSANTLYVLVTGISEISGNGIFNIYPNPSSGIININWNNSRLSDVRIEIRNMLGQSLYSTGQHILPESATLSIDLGEIAPGMYLIEMRSEEQIGSKRIIINR